MKKDTQSIYDLPLGDLQEEQPRRLRQRKKPRKWLWLTLAVVVVLGIVAAALLWDANSFDGLRRSVIYARAEKTRPAAPGSITMKTTPPAALPPSTAAW